MYPDENALFIAPTFRLPDAAGEKLPEVTEVHDVQPPIACVSSGLDVLAPLYWAATKAIYGVAELK